MRDLLGSPPALVLDAQAEYGKQIAQSIINMRILKKERGRIAALLNQERGKATRYGATHEIHEREILILHTMADQGDMSFEQWKILCQKDCDSVGSLKVFSIMDDEEWWEHMMWMFGEAIWCQKQHARDLQNVDSLLARERQRYAFLLSRMR